MLKEKEQEIERMARKMKHMDPSSLRIMHVLMDGLMAKENLDKEGKESEELRNI